MNNSEKKREIKDILFNHEKNVTWLKNKLHTNQDLHRLLSDRSVNFDIETYESIMNVFRKEGFITTENERCEKFAEQLIQMNGIISHSTYLLNSNASIFLKDNLLDFREKKKLMEIIDKIKLEFSSEMERIEKIIEG